MLFLEEEAHSHTSLLEAIQWTACATASMSIVKLKAETFYAGLSSWKSSYLD